MTMEPAHGWARFFRLLTVSGTPKTKASPSQSEIEEKSRVDRRHKAKSQPGVVLDDAAGVGYPLIGLQPVFALSNAVPAKRTASARGVAA